MGACECLATYSTVKIVKLKDKRLACLRLITLLGITGYLFFQLFGQYEYAKFVEPIGEVAVDIEASDKPEFSNNHSYCGNGGSVPPYPTVYAGGCRVWDQEQFQYGKFPSSSFITTRVEQQKQKYNATCNELGSSCTEPWTDNGKSENYYISQVEDYDFKLTTTFQAQKGAGEQTGIAGILSSSTPVNMTYYLSGKMVDEQGNTLKEFGPKVSDKFPISLLLKAAGVDSIDDKSDWTYNTPAHPPPEGTGGNATYRTLGMLIVVTVEFDNRANGLLAEPTYVYKATRVPNKKYLVTQMEPLAIAANITDRTLYDRYGIQVVFTIVGSIGYFDFTTLLLTLVGASALLGVSTMVVEFFMLQVFANKKTYNSYKFDEISVHDRHESGYSDFSE